jgi:deoxyribodipyrimidine photo-lyase
MIIGYGRPEVLVPKILEKLQGEIEAVWAQEEVTVEEMTMLDNLRGNLAKVKIGSETGVQLKLSDSKVFIPVDQLPYERKKNPDVYTSFRKKVEGLGIERGGMIVEPLKTTTTLDPGSQSKGVKIAIGKDDIKLKSMPHVKMGSIEVGKGQGGFISPSSDLNTVEGMYAKLVKPLLDNPPIAGWSSLAKDDKLPAFPGPSPIPFDGGEASALARLEDYVGHADNAGQKWVGGHKAKHYKATRNGLVGEGFSTKFSGFFALGCLSAREVGWRVGELLEYEGRNKDTYNNVYCE